MLAPFDFYSMLALFTLLSTAASVTAHFVNVTNDCHRLGKLTGTIRDARWRGRTLPLLPGKTYTEGDTTVHVSMAMGTVTSNLFWNGSTIDTKLKPAQGVVFAGTLGYDVYGSTRVEQAYCSAGEAHDCWGVVSLNNTNQWPSYVDLVVTC